MESAMLLIAAISGIMQGVQTWIATRDRREAKRALEFAYSRTLNSDQIRSRADRLLSIVPIATIDRLKDKIQACYEKFNKILDDDEQYFPSDIDNAAKNALPNCICRNLGRIVSVNGGALPDQELHDAWQKYGCSARGW